MAQSTLPENWVLLVVLQFVKRCRVTICTVGIGDVRVPMNDAGFEGVGVSTAPSITDFPPAILGVGKLDLVARMMNGREMGQCVQYVASSSIQTYKARGCE